MVFEVPKLMWFYFLVCFVPNGV